LTEQAQAEQWHLDKRVPIALIFTLAVQTLTVGLWAGGVQQRLATLEATVEQQSDERSRLIRVEERLGYVAEKINQLYERDRGR
jgi:hypothetical protein